MVMKMDTPNKSYRRLVQERIVLKVKLVSATRFSKAIANPPWRFGLVSIVCRSFMLDIS